MKNRIVTLTVNIDIWVGIDEEVNVQKEVEDTMAQLNGRTLEEFGGCHLLYYSDATIENEDQHNCMGRYEHVAQINGGG